MQVDQYGRVKITEDEACESLYANDSAAIDLAYINDTDSVDTYNQSRRVNADNIPLLEKISELEMPIEQFDKLNQKNWFIPEEYRSFDIVTWLFEKCTTDEQHARVSEELNLFVQQNMYDLLIYLKYLVDVMREHKIVWGVGRGSSVSSYVLFLIGVHKLDSLRYNLPITEFLK